MCGCDFQLLFGGSAGVMLVLGNCNCVPKSCLLSEKRNVYKLRENVLSSVKKSSLHPQTEQQPCDCFVL